MSSPLATETVLQGRYRLLRLLAEGGFARTYLAEDGGRFGERCAVKEFCPPSNDATVFEKAKELFQREAQTLYQLEHPQVPQFRAMFAEAVAQTQRLFLVQDYVEGDTYRSALRQRLQAGEHFSVQEVRQLLKQLLPILSYIHGKGIIHRDISPDNLILRSSDRKPVLIDFGVVKTVVTQLQQTNVMPSGTAVGKFGFAPIEQLQSGRAYPSSDLYSLAVCCLVLLTGLEPSQLFDDAAAVWHWRHHTSVGDGLADILDKMLAHKPSDRYSSADEVLQALQSMPFESSAAPPSTATAPARPSNPSPAAPVKLQDPPEASQAQTIAAERPEGLRRVRSQGRKIIPAVRTRPPARKPQSKAKTAALVVIGLLLALLSAGAGWLLMQFLMLRPWAKEPIKVSPAPIQSRAPQPAPTPTIRYSQTLDLIPGQSVTVQGTLQPGEAQTYRFEGSMDDKLSATLTAENTTFSLLKSDLTPVSRNSQKTTRWQGVLPQTDTYSLQVQNRSASQVRSFEFVLALAQPEPPPSPSIAPSDLASPSPTPAEIPPTIQTETLAFAPDSSLQRLTGLLLPAQIQRYTVAASAGQVLTAAVFENQAVTLTIRDPAGEPLNSAQNVLNWQALISEPGTYQIDVIPIDSDQSTSFAVEIGLKQP
ncbi:protein kinase [Altericista sp. CCNU0014]|uniref:protein kinase domain-containing protein n=1 Tax=Altericista sp. CCNU0014 TaxID=3082949 RepID=UPI00384FC3AF